MATAFYDLKVKEVRKETDDAVSVALEMPDNLKDVFAYKQGQYLTFEIEIDGEKVRRSYSLCSSPIENEWRVAIKLVPGGKFSSFSNKKLRAGMSLPTMPPMGRFFTEIEASKAKHYVAFAAGSGITPIMSIMKTVLAKEPQSTFTLFYSNKFFSTIIFKEELEDLKNKFMDRLNVHHLLSREETDSALFQGRLSGKKCELFSNLLFDKNKVDEYFICGPEEMILDVRDSLQNMGVQRDKIHVELFTTGAAQMAKRTQSKVEVPDSDKSNVKVIIDGNAFEMLLSTQGESILDASMKAGADVPFACKGGVCCTCRAKVLEGKVKMDINYALEESEVADGFILTCQSHPLSKNVVVDFDVL